MDQKIDIIDYEGFAVLKLDGRFLPGGDPDISEVMKAKFLELINRGVVKIIVDLRNVDFFASNSIGALISGYNLVSNAGGKIALWRPKTYIWDSLKLVKVDKMISIFSNEEDALAEIGIKIEAI